MFQKEALIKRYSFIMIDVFSLFIALVLSNLMRFGTLQLFQYDNLYIHVFVIALLACVMGNLSFHLDKHIFDRGYYQEFISVAKSGICIATIVMTYLVLSQEAIHYSRIQLIYFFVIYMVMDYVGHQLAKPIIANYYKNSRSCRKILLFTSSDKVDQVLERFHMTNNWYFDLSYIVIADKDMQGQFIDNIPVVANADNMLERIKNMTVDAVFINISFSQQFSLNIKQILHDFQSMGIIVHVNIDALELDVADKVIENLGAFKVVSYTNKLRNSGQLIIKKIIDMIGAIVGLIITGVISIILVPLIRLDSKGPAFYAQTRVGKNGRHFKMYKFRSMYMDADKRKEELMEKNEMQGAMFKMENDPRITRVGKFIRKYSLDELPQFYNVLKGDMSLVGTRPPTVDEVEKYKVEQKRRLSVTPGMTGLWQVSGRSDIYDFDQIVKLDLEYIDKWSIGLDLKLLIKTIVVCFEGKGAR